jgi:hypothetical protein
MHGVALAGRPNGPYQPPGPRPWRGWEHSSVERAAARDERGNSVASVEYTERDQVARGQRAVNSDHARALAAPACRSDDRKISSSQMSNIDLVKSQYSKMDCQSVRSCVQWDPTAMPTACGCFRSGLQLDGRTTYLNNASYQLRVVFIGCTGLDKAWSLSAQPANTPHPRHPRRGSANVPDRPSPDAAGPSTRA